MNLCDTDWVIDLLKGRAEAERLIHPMIAGGLALSVISVGEIYQGITYGKDPEWNERQFDELLDRVIVVGPDVATMRIYATIRGQLHATGMPIGDNDVLIAATALRHDLTLVTRNRRHFERIPDLQLHEMA